VKFWDASALIPLCIDEPQTRIVRDIAKKDSDIVAWWGSPVECSSAFARLRREGILKEEELARIRRLLLHLSDTWTEIEPSDDVRNTAGRLLFIHPLHAADSFQLAAALVWADKSPQGHQFVCLDRRLREIAEKEGFLLLPENLPVS